MARQGQQCVHCSFDVHHKCAKRVPLDCQGATAQPRSTATIVQPLQRHGGLRGGAASLGARAVAVGGGNAAAHPEDHLEPFANVSYTVLLE